MPLQNYNSSLRNKKQWAANVGYRGHVVIYAVCRKLVVLKLSNECMIDIFAIVLTPAESRVSEEIEGACVWAFRARIYASASGCFGRFAVL